MFFIFSFNAVDINHNIC